MATVIGVHLVQRAPQQPPAQRCIGYGMAKRDAACCIEGLWRVEMRDVAAQTRKRIEACVGHALLLSGGWPSSLLLDCSAAFVLDMFSYKRRLGPRVK
ncbi:MAG: hypothetical protein JWQ82_27 [Tardiphaga sp.]|nr:hypothetical protein [Tardiphaga sp.]